MFLKIYCFFGSARIHILCVVSGGGFVVLAGGVVWRGRTRKRPEQRRVFPALFRPCR